MKRQTIYPLALLGLAASVAFLLSCGGSNNSSINAATVQLSVSDPATPWLG